MPDIISSSDKLRSSISKPKPRPPIVTICGDAGTGKTTLAATFPDPIFIGAEDGLQSIPEDKRPDAFPLLQNSGELWDQLRWLIKEKHDYKTLVIDGVTALERLFIESVLESDTRNPASINQALGGYGAGLSAVSVMHYRVRKAAAKLNEKGMSIVFVAHVDTETIELPDLEAYTRYALRLNKKSQAPYLDDVDLVGFIKLETFTKDGEYKKNLRKAVSSGSRLLTTYSTAANVSKNRYGITEDLVVKQGENPLIEIIRGKR